MDTFLAIFPIVWSAFIYSIIFYRVFIKDNKHIKENIGLIVIASILLLTNDQNQFIELSCVIISVVLLGSIIYKATKSRNK